MKPLPVLSLATTIIIACSLTFVRCEPGQAASKDSYGSTPSSEYDAYGQHDTCPQPQSADWIDNAYETHYTFNWADLAAEVAAEGSPDPKLPKTGTKPPGSTKQPGTRPPFWKRAVDEAMGKGRNIHRRSDAAVVQQPTQGDDAAGQPGAKARGPSAGGSSKTNKVHPSYVTNPEFLAPTDSQESDKGFQGTWDVNMPTDASLAVGPHPQDPGIVLVLHGVKRAFEIFAATRDGRQVPTAVPTKIGSWQIAKKMGYDMVQTDDGFTTVDTNAFYDLKEHRYVITFSSSWYSYGPEDTPLPPMFICASANNNPLGQWTCWALKATVQPQIYVPMCAGQPGYNYYADYPQMSYSHDGIFVVIAGICADAYTEDLLGYLSALLVFSKKTLYSTPAADAQDLKVYRAGYLPTSSWYRSLSAKEQLLIYNTDYPSDNAFNAPVLPSRPIHREDVHHPIFVMGKPDGGAYMSFARLTDEPLDEMVSRQTAPRIYATVIGKGADFRNAPGFPDGNPIIPQPGDVPPLQVNGVGLYGFTYGASHHRGLVYVATHEYFGVGDNRVPSIYWAIVDPSEDLCKPSLENWGLLASEQGLSLAYPVIVPRDCGVLLAYVYGGNTNVTLNGQTFLAYAGVASSIVGCRDEKTSIDVVKRGERLIDRRPEIRSGRWGDFSAFSVLGDDVWFVASIALDIPYQYGSWIWSDRLGELDALY